MNEQSVPCAETLPRYTVTMLDLLSVRIYLMQCWMHDKQYKDEQPNRKSPGKNLRSLHQYTPSAMQIHGAGVVPRPPAMVIVAGKLSGKTMLGTFGPP